MTMLTQNVTDVFRDSVVWMLVSMFLAYWTSELATVLSFVSTACTCRSGVELNSTARLAVPDPMSSSHRHVILQCFGLVSRLSCCYPVG